uniref:Uncharacterized protein n=1 Tax=Arundo donax TaxID=35708 RepID=A0A0A9DYZ3_ARUDO
MTDAAEYDQLLHELHRPAFVDLLASLHRDSGRGVADAEDRLVDGPMCSFPDDVGLVEATCGLHDISSVVEGEGDVSLCFQNS